MGKTKDKPEKIPFSKKNIKLSEKSLQDRLHNKKARKRALVRYFNQTTDSDN